MSSNKKESTLTEVSLIVLALEIIEIWFPVRSDSDAAERTQNLRLPCLIFGQTVRVILPLKSLPRSIALHLRKGLRLGEA